MRLKQFIDLINEDREFLAELRNVANVEELKDILAGIAARIQSPMHQKWFVKNGLKYFVNQGEATQITDPRQLQKIFGIPNVPDWAKQAMQSPDGLWEILMSQEEYSDLDGMVDWINTLPEQPIQMNLERAKAESDAWHARFAQQQAGTEEQESDVKTIMEFPDGSKWVELMSHNALSVESDKMGHCIGGELCEISGKRKVETSYWPLIERGAARALSLRGPNNEPHITVELGGDYNTRDVQIEAVGKMAEDHEPEIDARGREPYTVWEDLIALLGKEQAKAELHKHFMEAIPKPEQWGIRQIKGKQNKKPVAKYQPYLTKLLNKLRLPIFADTHHHDAPRMRHRPNQWIDKTELKKDGNLHYYNDLTIEDQDGVYRFKDVSSENESTGSPTDLFTGGKGKFTIKNTDVRYVGNVDVGALVLGGVPDLTFRGEFVLTSKSAMHAATGASAMFHQSKVTFGPKVKSFDYDGLHINESVVLNMPPFHRSTGSARGDVTVVDSTVEFPEITISQDNPKEWQSLGMDVTFRDSKVRLPKSLGAIDNLVIQNCQTNFDEVEWVNCKGVLKLIGTPFRGLPKKVVAGAIWTDQPERVAKMVHNGVELAGGYYDRETRYGYICDQGGRKKYEVIKDGMTGEVKVKKLED